MSEWRPIETAPKDGTTILVYRFYAPFGWHVMGYARWSEIGDRISGWLSYGFSDPPGNLGLGAPTHWHPLPSPPQSPLKDSEGDGG